MAHQPVLVAVCAVALAAASACGDPKPDRSSIRRAPALENAASTWIVRGPTSVVLIDPPSTPSDVEALADELGRREPAALLLTGGPPNPLRGLDAFRETYPSTPIFTTEAVLATLGSAGDGVETIESHPSYEAEATDFYGLRPEGCVQLGGRIFLVRSLSTTQPGLETAMQPRVAYYLPYPEHAVFTGTPMVRGVMAPDPKEGVASNMLWQAAESVGGWSDVVHSVMVYPRWGEPGLDSTTDTVYGDWWPMRLHLLCEWVEERMTEDGRLEPAAREEIHAMARDEGWRFADDDPAVLDGWIDRFAANGCYDSF